MIGSYHVRMVRKATSELAVRAGRPLWSRRSRRRRSAGGGAREARMEAEVDGTILPFTFYCRNARLCLKKAIAARKFQLPAQELSHLRKFLKLVSVVLPCHPLFLDPKHQKACEELQRHLDGTRQRVKELEQAIASSTDELPRALDCPRAQPRTPPACTLRHSSRPRSPVKSAALHRPETSITPRIHGRVRPKRRLDSPAASGSCASTGCKKKPAGSWDFLTNLHQRYPYAFSRKHRSTSTTRKSTPLATKPCWEPPDGGVCAAESLKSCTLSGEVSPFRSRFVREMPRVGALSLLTSESPVKTVEAGATGSTATWCEREREEGASSCAAFREKDSSPLHVSPPTRQFDLGSGDRVRTLVQGASRLDLPPSPSPPGRHLEKRPRSRSPQQGCWPTSMRQRDRADETHMPASTPERLHSKPPPPSRVERVENPVSPRAYGETPWEEETPPKSRTSRFSKKTRVDPCAAFFGTNGCRRPHGEKKKPKTEEGEDTQDDDSSVGAHGLFGGKTSSISSSDCRQHHIPPRPATAPMMEKRKQEDDDEMRMQAEQFRGGQENIAVRDDCEQFRAELRSLQAEVQDSEATKEAHVSTEKGAEGAHSGKAAGCLRGPGGVRECVEGVQVCREGSVMDEDVASSTRVEDAATPVGRISKEPIPSAKDLAAQREKLMNLFQKTKSFEEKGRAKQQKSRNGRKLLDPGGKGGRNGKAAKARVDGEGRWSPCPSSSSSSYQSSAPDQSASLSSLSLCHYAQKMNEPNGRTHPEPSSTRPATSSIFCGTAAEKFELHKDSKSPLATPPRLSSPSTSSSSSPILLPTSFHGNGDCCPVADRFESSKCCKGTVSDSSTACSLRAQETPVREQKIEGVLGRCADVAASQGGRAGSPGKPKRERGGARQGSRRTNKATLQNLQGCAQGEDGCCDLKIKPNPKPHRLPPPSCFFIDMSDKLTNSSEDNSWCKVQDELRKTFIKNTSGIPSALGAHNENPDFLGNRLVSFVSQKLQTVQNELYEKKLSSLNRLVGELRGCVEGFRIRIDVEGEGWRGRVVGLEKELECLKDETEEELGDIKSRLLRELKVKMDQIVAEKVESDDCCRERLMEEMKCFKTEMGCFVRDASKKVFMSEVHKLLTDHHADIAETRTDIKKELQSFLEDKLEKAIYEALENPNGYFRKHLHHIRRVAAEAKMESQGLKKLEEALKAESKHIRKVVTRLEKDDIKRKLELEEFRRLAGEIDYRPKTAGCKRDVSREKSIMERVESLSQMYLGGLEEVRSDLYSVKRSCRDRVNAIEAQWTDFRKQQEVLDKGEPSTSCSGQVPRKYMLELDRFRDDLEEIKESIKGRCGSMMCDLDSNGCLQRLVETERGYVRGLLERESSLIRGQVIDICEANKSEIAGILKSEVQKRVSGLRDKGDCMSSALKTDADALQRSLLEAQEGSEEVAAALKRTEKDRDKAAAAAAEACQAASRASEVLEQVMGSFSNEMASARRKTVELQEGLISEARRASADVQQQREIAVAAVAEARISSEKVGSILEEVVGTFSTEMGQAKRKSLMLQENLDKEMHRVKGIAKEIESTSAKAGKTISDFTCEMECTRRKSLQLQEGLEKDIASILESEKRKLFATPEEPTCSASPKLEQQLEAVKGDLRQLANRVDGLADGRSDNQGQAGAQDAATREESMRLCVLEKKIVDASSGQSGVGDGVCLRLEHIEKRGAETSGRHEVLSIQHKGGGISVSVPFRHEGDRGDGSHAELLQGDSMMGGYHRLEGADTCGAGSSFDSRIANLESRLENVASATFSNLRLLDGKVEHVSVGVQAALEGAACAENKCAALGVELVKVFRMLARRPGSAASPGADSCDQSRYNDGPMHQDQSPSSHVPVRQGNLRKGCPVHDPEVNDTSWPSTHHGADCQLMQPTKDTGPSNPSQRTKIKLDGGRIQVNVTSHHRHNKRPAPGSDMIVVQ